MDAWTYALVFQSISELVDALPAVRDQPYCFGQAAKQGGSGVVTHLASGREELQWPSLRIRHVVQLGVQAALRPADQTPALIVGPPARRLARPP